MIQQQQKASPALLKKYMDERVPVIKRLEGVYIPTVLTDNVCLLSEQIFSIVKDSKYRAIGSIIRRMKSIIQKYRSTNLTVMRTDLYNKVDEASMDFFQWVQPHLIVDQCTYVRELWAQRPNIHSSTESSILGMVYFTKMVVEYIIRYERNWSEQIQEYLGDAVRYRTSDNVTCTSILKCLDDIIEAMKAPSELDSSQIRLSYQIFKNKVGHIDVINIGKI